MLQGLQQALVTSPNSIFRTCDQSCNVELCEHHLKCQNNHQHVVGIQGKKKKKLFSEASFLFWFVPLCTLQIVINDSYQVWQLIITLDMNSYRPLMYFCTAWTQPLHVAKSAFKPYFILISKLRMKRLQVHGKPKYIKMSQTLIWFQLLYN